ncbi:hypothetical protein BBJ28_00019739 [Nothophytophthora sp. Chile5]|nr:hypothetical protein BBJ28_00019739 [Nothophytophthora sp. Chile5]
MRLGQVLLLQLLALSSTHISQASGQGWSGGSGSTQTGSGSVGDGSVAVILPVDSLQDQLLTTRDIDPNSLVRVASSYDALGEGPEVIGQVQTANTTVFTSVLIVPTLANASSIPLKAGEGPLESATADADELPGRTQIMYNCTSTSSLWNLLDDANVLRLDNFQQLEGNDSGDAGSSWSAPQVHAGSSENATEAARTSVAIANVVVADCLGLHNSSVGRVVVGNSFFGVAFSNSSTYFYVLNSSVSDDTSASTSTPSSSPSSGSCLLRLEMARATLAEVYPRCSIKFHSTDMSNLIRNTPVVPSDVVGGTNRTNEAQARRLLEASSFGFIKDPACYLECGEGLGIEKDQCWAYINNLRYQLQCKMQFYAENSACTSECGDDDLPVSQCYDCYDTLFSCRAGYSSSGWFSCCRILSCTAIADTTVASPKGLTWNLKDDAKTVNQSSYPIYQAGDCSNPSDPSTTCCRITCENCFLNLSIASMFSDVDVYITQFDVEMASELRLTGNSSLNVKIFAPNGCTLLDKKKSLFNHSLPIYGVPGISDISVEFAVGLGAKLSLKPHGTTVVFGTTTAIHNFTAGH